jgi:hypothetical protein
MSNIYWKRAMSANFGKPGAWKGGGVPGASDNAVLDATGSDFTVTSNKAETVASIQLAANATLDITSKIFTASAGTGSGENAGTIGIDDTAVLSVGEHLENTGVISLNGAGSSDTDAATLMISSDTTLDGGGALTLSDNPYNGVICDGTTLTNVDNVISGAGVIGSRKMGFTLVNEAGGVIDATGANLLEISRIAGPEGFITNDGLLEGTGSGGLLIDKVTLTGAGGSIIAGGGSFVELGASTVSGQSLSTQAGGNVTVVLSYVTVDTLAINAGYLKLYSGQLALNGGVTNSGLMIVQSGVLSVGGDVTGNGKAYIYGGELALASRFSQDVVFASSKGVGTLQLGDSQSYTGDITGFAATGRSVLNLLDIGFVGAGEATFSGTASGGVLTVTDGTYTANITMTGDYLKDTFVASGDGQGGVAVVAMRLQTPSAAHFVSAMAAIGGHSAAVGLIDACLVNASRQMMLAAPRLALA